MKRLQDKPIVTYCLNFRCNSCACETIAWNKGWISSQKEQGRQMSLLVIVQVVFFMWMYHGEKGKLYKMCRWCCLHDCEKRCAYVGVRKYLVTFWNGIPESGYKGLFMHICRPRAKVRKGFVKLDMYKASVWINSFSLSLFWRISMILGNDNKDQSNEKQLEAGQTTKHDLKDHENELGYNKV